MKSVKIKRLRIFAFASGFLCSLGANATDGIVCSGTIEEVGLHSQNAVLLRLSSMNTRVKICDLGSKVGSTHPIPAEQCKAIYSTLLSAYSMGKTISSAYFDNVESGTSCSNFAPWELATLRWVSLAN